MNPWGLLAALVLIAGSASAAVWERGEMLTWKAKYNLRVAQEQTAAQQAKDDAAKQEAADLQNLQSQSQQAIQQSQLQTEQARKQLTVYQTKLAAAASVKDDGHRCAGIEIPKDLIP